MDCLAAVSKKDATAFGSRCGLSAQGLNAEDPGAREVAWTNVLIDNGGLRLSDAKVTGGRALATEAELFVEGKDTESKFDVKGSIFMKKTPEGWVYVRGTLKNRY